MDNKPEQTDGPGEKDVDTTTNSPAELEGKDTQELRDESREKWRENMQRIEEDAQATYPYVVVFGNEKSEAMGLKKAIVLIKDVRMPTSNMAYIVLTEDGPRALSADTFLQKSIEQHVEDLLNGEGKPYGDRKEGSSEESAGLFVDYINKDDPNSPPTPFSYLSVIPDLSVVQQAMQDSKEYAKAKMEEKTKQSAQAEVQKAKEFSAFLNKQLEPSPVLTGSAS